VHTNEECSDSHTNSVVWWVSGPLLCILFSPLFSVTVSFSFVFLHRYIQTNCKIICTENALLIYSYVIASEVLTAVVVKSSIFWGMASCSPLRVKRRFGGTCRLKHQDLRIHQTRDQQSLLPASWWFLARLLLITWRWRLRVPRNVDWLLVDYTALHPTRHNSLLSGYLMTLFKLEGNIKLCWIAWEITNGW
jgi:type IV secretory pathway VirB3-like protein